MKLSKPKKSAAPQAVDFSETHDFSRAVKPRPDLVPHEVRQARGFAATVRATAFSVVAISGVAVIGFLAVGGAALSAKSDAASADQQNSIVNQKIASLSDVQRYNDDLSSRKKDIQSAFASALDYSTLYDAVFDNLPSGVSLTSFDVAPGQKCAGGDPFNPQPSIGCITVQATAPNSSAITDFSKAVSSDKDGVLVDAYASEITNAGDSQSFKLTVNYTQKAYSTKYSNFGESVGTASPAQTATPTPSPDADASGSSPDTSSDTNDAAAAPTGK